MFNEYRDRMYRTGEPCSHCAEYEDHLRRKWLWERSKQRVTR